MLRLFFYCIGNFFELTYAIKKPSRQDAHDALKEDCHCRDSASALESGEPDSFFLLLIKFKGGIMKNQNQSTILKQKALSLTVLFGSALFIIFLGMFFCAFSFMNNISFKVLNAQIPGVIFGLLVMYLGIRYYLSVDRLKVEIYKNASGFSFSNLKKQKKK